ncbi:MAG: hypothetical protein KatS3mg109_2010 [Pirellulaceae bacterium]|nr:MAG: hypothetical protein KatS3mg109_2010 [Pirellulaceae bacterium]
MQRLQFRAMGSTITIVIDSDDPTARPALNVARQTFLRYEQILSRFRSHSELSALNRRAGRGPVRVGYTLWRAVQHALRAASASDGIVTPTVGAALVAAGYDRDFATLTDGVMHRPAAAQPAPAWRHIRLDPQSAYYRPPRRGTARSRRECQGLDSGYRCPSLRAPLSHARRRRWRYCHQRSAAQRCALAN